METIVGTAVKQAKDTLIGMLFEEMNNGTIFIKSIDPQGLFSTTDLKVGMTVVRINDESLVGKNLLYALNLIKAVEGELKIEASPVRQMGRFSTTTSLVTSATHTMNAPLTMLTTARDSEMNFAPDTIPSHGSETGNDIPFGKIDESTPNRRIVTYILSIICILMSFLADDNSFILLLVGLSFWTNYIVGLVSVCISFCENCVVVLVNCLICDVISGFRNEHEIMDQTICGEPRQQDDLVVAIETAVSVTDLNDLEMAKPFILQKDSP